MQNPEQIINELARYKISDIVNKELNFIERPKNALYNNAYYHMDIIVLCNFKIQMRMDITDFVAYTYPYMTCYKTMAYLIIYTDAMAHIDDEIFEESKLGKLYFI